MANELHGSSTPKYEIMHVLQNEVFFNQNIDCKQTESETYCTRNGAIFPIPEFFFPDKNSTPCYLKYSLSNWGNQIRITPKKRGTVDWVLDEIIGTNSLYLSTP